MSHFCPNRPWTSYNDTMCGLAPGKPYHNAETGMCDAISVPNEEEQVFIRSPNSPVLASLQKWQWTTDATQVSAPTSTSFLDPNQQVVNVWATGCNRPGYNRSVEGLCVLGSKNGR